MVNGKKYIAGYCKEIIYNGTQEFSFEELRAIRYRAKHPEPVSVTVSNFSDVKEVSESQSRDLHDKSASITSMPSVSQTPTMTMVSKEAKQWVDLLFKDDISPSDDSCSGLSIFSILRTLICIKLI